VGGGGFPLFRLWTGRMLRIRSIGGDLRFGRHDFWNAPSYASLDPGVRGTATEASETIDKEMDVIFLSDCDPLWGRSRNRRRH
jgi:hypothetical protein